MARQQGFLEQPNLLCIFSGAEPSRVSGRVRVRHDWILEMNLDDVPGEVIGYCFEQLFAAARSRIHDATQMKKKPRICSRAAAKRTCALEAIYSGTQP